MSTLIVEHLDNTAASVPRVERADVTDAKVDSAPPLVPSMNNKEQLHQRVEERLSDLQVALDRLDAPMAQGERGRALAEAIATARSSMSGGWDHVGEVEAAHLAHWLGATEGLRVTSPGMPIVPLSAERGSQGGCG